MNDSTKTPVAVDIDLALLREAGQLLEDADFTVANAALPTLNVPWLLAENGLFVMGIIAARTLDDLVALEAYGAEALAELIRGAGPKRWDAYLVLLAREDREARGTRIVRDLQYDTNQFRRIVNLGVRPDLEGVRRALKPFLPLPTVPHAVLQPALQDLIGELELLGIERDRALQALHTYQQHASA